MIPFSSVRNIHLRVHLFEYKFLSTYWSDLFDFGNTTTGLRSITYPTCSTAEIFFGELIGKFQFSDFLRAKSLQ